jgi:penicillin-insensitive murein endopeptidase
MKSFSDHLHIHTGTCLGSETNCSHPDGSKGRHALRIRKQAHLVVSVLTLCMPCLVNASTCYGAVGNGRLSDGVQLPVQGDNFVAYSVVAVELGRTYVHSLVRQAVLDAYANVRKTMPDKTYVYGESGFAHGGRIPPHRTHQAGLSVDFMVPVFNDANRSVPLPSTPSNKFGYGLEFDDQGRIPGFRIDFDAMAEHLYQISIAAHQHGIAIDRVIFDRRLMERLFSSSQRGAELRRTMPFMKERPWIRHDEHYHIDFRIPCLPLREYPDK